MGTVSDFITLLSAHGSIAQYHRSDSMIPCPCLTPEGFRDPEWHIANPSEPVCDENGMLPDPANTVDISVRAFVQPAQSTRLTRLSDEYLEQMFGDIQTDDHVGIFPCAWSGSTLDFYDWSQSGQDYILYNNRKFLVVNANLIPDPDDGDPYHHWECALRLIS